MEFWNYFTYHINTTHRQKFSQIGFFNSCPFKTSIIPQTLKDLTDIIISKMAKPEEVLVVVDENGNAVEELIQDAETVALYNT